MEIKEQIQQKIINDPAFAAALKEAKNAGEACKALLAAGFQLTEEERKGLEKADVQLLSEDDLGKVAGGDDWHIVNCKNCKKSFLSLTPVDRCPECNAKRFTSGDSDKPFSGRIHKGTARW